MKKQIQVVLVAMGLTLVSAACDRGKAEAERRAQEATLTAAKVQAQTDESAKLKAAHTESRDKLQKDLDASDRKATYLKQKAAHTVGTTKKNADAAITELDARHTAAKASLSKLGDDASPAWDAMRKTAEDDVAAVGKAVDTLEGTLGRK